MEISRAQDLIPFFYSLMLLVPSEGGDYSENEIKSYQSRDEYCYSGSLSSCVDNQRNCLLLSQKAREQFLAFGVFCEKKPPTTKAPHFCIKNENLHTRFSDSPKSNREAKKEKTS